MTFSFFKKTSLKTVAPAVEVIIPAPTELTHPPELVNQTSLKTVAPAVEVIIPAPTELTHPPELVNPLDIAIFYHEKDLLGSSAYYLQKSATENNSIGTLLYALILRHGIGLIRNEILAFELLEKNSNEILMDISSQEDAQSTLSRFKAKEELSLVFFELAMSFRNGYGTKKNILSCIYYLKVVS
jgi:hypothetical protein